MIRPALLAAAAAATLAGCGRADEPAADATATPAPQETSTMNLTSSAFAGGGTIPAEYTCDGAGRSPPLEWRGAPAKTQSFALIVEDPDAPKGTFRHWGVYDIPAQTHELAAGTGGNGAPRQTKNDFGKPGYGPPCPPRGDSPHHYRFRLMALDVAHLSGSPADVKDLLDAADSHVVGIAELTALYGRS